MGAEESKQCEYTYIEHYHQTRLLFKRVRRVDSANRLFGAWCNRDTVLIINPGRSPVKPYIRVPEGTYALVQHQGRDLDFVKSDGTKSAVWPPGYHFASPFTKVSHLVTKQYVVFETPVKGCKTADDVTVRIDMCLVFRIMGDESKGEDPNLVRRFVYELGANGLEVQLRAAQDEAVRALARSVQHTEVYQLRDGTMKERFQTGALNFRNPGFEHLQALQTKELADHDDDVVLLETNDPPQARVVYCVMEDIKRNLNQQFNTYGVQITSAMITDVKLPEQFQAQMQARTTHLSTIKQQDMKQKSDMQLLQYKEEIDTTKLERRMIFMEEEQRGKAKSAEIQKEIDMIQADAILVQEQIEQETRCKCATIRADAELKIAQIRAETERIAKEIAMHCDTEIGLLEAQTEALQLELQATTDAILKSAEAQAQQVVALAEGEAANKLQALRKHLLELQRLDVMASLAQNQSAVVSGDTSNNLLADVLVANRQQNILVNIDSNRIVESTK